jgi:RNA polymerase sigma-70 factor, ECF subfamily
VAWLVRVLVTLGRDRRRRVRRRPVAGAHEVPEHGHDPEPGLVAAAAVQAALGSLTARRRAVVVLHELEDLPVSEIARLLDVHAVTVRWHLSQARRELRARLSTRLSTRPSK